MSKFPEPSEIFKCWRCGKKFTILARKNKHEPTCPKRPTNGAPQKDVKKRFGGKD